MTKGERISQFVEELTGEVPDIASRDIAHHPCYTGFFRCWNEQRYYEAHDVLEHLWLSTNTDDADYFKALIQAAGAFVHLQKQFLRPTHPKDGRRLHPAVRLFDLALANLAKFSPTRHQFDVVQFQQMLRNHRDAVIRSDYRTNPWSPDSAPKLELS